MSDHRNVKGLTAQDWLPVVYGSAFVRNFLPSVYGNTIFWFLVNATCEQSYMKKYYNFSPSFDVLPHSITTYIVQLSINK